MSLGKNVDKTEDEEQDFLFRWANFSAEKYPELLLMYHIPNGGSRNKAEAAKLKRMGVKAGVPDICLPVARKGFFGLYIELKREEHGRVTAAQKSWLNALNKQGYKAVVCHGFDEAREEIEKYLK